MSLVAGTRLWTDVWDGRRNVWEYSTVVKIGRRWATLDRLDHLGAPVKVSIEGAHGRHREEPAGPNDRRYLTDDEYVAHLHRVFAMEARGRIQAALLLATPETILTVAHLLNVPAPAALPTKEEVLAQYGVTP